ncbi:hypothetical protein D1872_297010 [compost metagenome]
MMVLPHQIEQFFPGDDPSHPLHQRFKQDRFLLGEHDRLISPRDRKPFGVQQQPGAAHGSFLLFCGISAVGSPQVAANFSHHHFI